MGAADDLSKLEHRLFGEAATGDERPEPAPDLIRELFRRAEQRASDQQENPE